MGDSSALSYFYDLAKRFDPLVKLLTIFGAIAGTGTLYSLGLYRPLGIPFSVLVDHSLIAQSIFVAIIFMALAIVSARFFFLTHFSGRVFLPVAERNPVTERSRRQTNQRLREKLSYGRAIARSAHLAWHIKTGHYIVFWAIQLIHVVASRAIDLFFFLVQWTCPIIVATFFSYLFRDFVSLRNVLVALISPCIVYFLVVATLEMRSPVPSRKGIYRYRARISRRLSRPSSLLEKKGGIAGLVFVYATAIHAVGTARHHTLLDAPHTCAIGQDINLKGSLVAENSRGYFFSTRVLSEDDPLAVFVQRDAVHYLVSPCLEGSVEA